MRKPEFNIHSFPPGHQLGIDDREIARVSDFGLPPNFVRSSGRIDLRHLDIPLKSLAFCWDELWLMIGHLGHLTTLNCYDQCWILRQTCSYLLQKLKKTLLPISQGLPCRRFDSGPLGEWGSGDGCEPTQLQAGLDGLDVVLSQHGRVGSHSCW